MRHITWLFLTGFFVVCSPRGLHAQTARSANLVYVDDQGVLRWTRTHQEAAFFGVNYTVPFAYSYRAHQALHVDPEQAIREDVYHLARLGLDAFRVHIWDTEISDSLGNLLENEHLRLFDYLLAELKKRNIRAILTPIAFWGNGYPERDEQTPGFSRVFGKGRATVNDTAIRAQENYLKQLFRHVNPYTRTTYGEDPNVIAVELNNEPSHSGPKSGVTAYINRLAAAMRGIGWTKPLFYNISQSPYYADAVAQANVNGFSFQWYPSGLVGGAELKGNYLPNVDKYVIPYDTIPAFHHKARMVYEFDAADVLQSDMYPAIARSFRTAGFQWATQFAYDPMALAYANTEYQTHYLNLVYTPSKAISLLIASEAFHTLPRDKAYGTYPMDSVFGPFRVSYRNNLSELNTPQKFYYSNSTEDKPVEAASLDAVAGVGSSAVVDYPGSGAYFVDKVAEGIWRLEVLPDAVHIRDPFARPAPSREATRVQWDDNPMSIRLPDLGEGFAIKGLNEGNQYSGVAEGVHFTIRPGTYLLTKAGTPPRGNAPAAIADPLPGHPSIGMTEFVAPEPYSRDLFLRHEPYTEVSPGKPFTITARAVGLDTGVLLVEIDRTGGGARPRILPMSRNTSTTFSVEVPAELVTPGILQYRIIMREGATYAVFPGNHKGDPFAWDNPEDETYTTWVAAEDEAIELYNPARDRNAWVYPPFRRNFQASYITGDVPGQLLLRMGGEPSAGPNGAEARTGLHQANLTDQSIGFQYSFAGRLDGRLTELGECTRLVIRAKGGGTARLTLITRDAFAYSVQVPVTGEMRDITVPLSAFTPDSAWVMPRPYPGFQPLWFKAGGTPPPLSPNDIEKVQVTLDNPSGITLEVAYIRLQKK